VPYVVLLGLLALLALLTAYEMAIFSTRPEHMRNASDAGDRRATMVMTFLRNPSRIIAALQLAATAAGLALGSLMQSAITAPATVVLAQRGWGEPAAERIAFWGVLTVSTLVTLLVTNLVPKRIAYSLADPLSVAWARPVYVWQVVAAPVARSIGRMADGLVRLCRIELPPAPAVTEADIRVLLRQGRLRGTIDDEEMAIVLRAFRLSDVRVTELMTPRERVVWLDLDLPLAKRAEFVRTGGRSVLPAGTSLDTARGVVRAIDVLENPAVEPRLGPLPRVSSGASALRALEEFRRSGGRMALVVDDHGVAVGVLTFNDLVRALLGEMSCIA
jgi:putative hemolysin